MKLLIAHLDPETRDPSDPYEVHRTFPDTPNALTEALEYWDTKSCHKWGCMALLLEDEFNVIALKLTQRIFADMNEDLTDTLPGVGDEISGD